MFLIDGGIAKIINYLLLIAIWFLFPFSVKSTYDP